MANAFVLAAGEDHGRLEQMSGTPFRALIEVGGRPMVERVLAALRESQRTGRIAVVAPGEVLQRLPPGLADLTVAPGETLLDNVMRGLNALGDGELVLFAHADAPLVTAEAIDDFLCQAEPLRPDLAWAIVPREEVEKRFPRGHRTYVHLREGSFTGTNLVLVNPVFVVRHQDLVRQFYQHRKSPLRLAGMLGAELVLRLLTGRLTIAHLEHRVSQVLGGQARAIISRHPGLAFDVDKPEDLEKIRELVGD
jgi:GTP:adenosylcobinamide-phosphate guanylyltransferase